MKIKMLVTAVVVGTLLSALAGPVSADPIAKGEPLTLHCDQPVGTVNVVIPPGNGTFTPGLSTSGQQVLVPYAFHGVFTFTPTGGATETGTLDVARPAPHNGRLVTCTAHQAVSDSTGSFTSDLTVQGFYTNV